MAEVSERVYRVVVTRESSAWLADVPDVPGTHTWAKSLKALHQSVREVIAMQEDLPDGAEAGLELDLEYVLGEPELAAQAASLRELRRRLERDEEKLAAGTAATVERLTRDGYSVRDVAALLSISPQRVSQIQPQSRTWTKRETAARSSAARSAAASALSQPTGKKVKAAPGAVAKSKSTAKADSKTAAGRVLQDPRSGQASGKAIDGRAGGKSGSR